MTDPPARTTGALSEPTDGCARSYRKSRANRRVSGFSPVLQALLGSLGQNRPRHGRGGRTVASKPCVRELMREPNGQSRLNSAPETMRDKGLSALCTLLSK